jgi:integrase
MRGIMRRIYKVGIVHGHASSNPVDHVETRWKTEYRAIVITPEQTLAILHSLPSLLHFTLVLTCSATALRASEMLSLRWADVLWEQERIRISKRWAKGEDGETKEPKHRMATFHCMPCLRISCVSGGHRRRMPPMRILSFRL